MSWCNLSFPLSLWFLACLLFIVISTYVSLNVPIAQILHRRQIPEFTFMNKSSATIQIIVWLLVYIVFIYFNEG